MKKSLLMIAGVTCLALAAGPAMAQKKTLAVVVKGLDNPFFTVLGDGCKKWNDENPKSEYTCLYTGPASSADEAGEVQIVEDLIIIAGDTLPPQLDALKAGRSHVQIGQRPFEMGRRAPTVLIDLIGGKKVADPLYTGLDECTPANLGKCPAK